MSLSNNYPALSPSLLLDFAGTKQLDPRITFTRATTATYYNGVTTAKAEENLLLYSQALATGPWGGLRSTRTNNAGTAPDGTNTATLLTQQAGQTTSGAVVQSLSVTANATTSVFAKADSKNFLIIQTQSSGVLRTWFNLSTGAVGTTNANHTASIVNVGNGWYRCTVTSSQTGDGTTFYLADADNSVTVTDSGSILLWGAQLEQRSAVTAYTATTTQPITNYIPVLQTAASGVARFDHNPTTGESLGLLVEEQRTNLLTYSEQFDNAAWTNTASSIIANTIVAPDGTLTGDKLVESTSTSGHLLLRTSNSWSPSTTYTVSFYAKAGERSVVQVSSGYFVFNNLYVNFDLENGVISAQSLADSSSISPVGNGWYRCSVTMTSLSSITGYTTVPAWGVYTQNSPTAARGNSYTGDGYSGIYLWGAQLEVGAFPTSYIPTTSATVTRNKDEASMTGTNFSSWFNNAEGTFYGNIKNTATSGNRNIFTISDGTANNRVRLYYNTPLNYLTAYGVVSGSGVISGSTSTILDATNILGALAYKVNDCAFVQGGGVVTTDTIATIPVVTKLTIGSNWSGTSDLLNGCIAKLSYYPARITDAQLQALTT